MIKMTLVAAEYHGDSGSVTMRIKRDMLDEN